MSNVGNAKRAVFFIAIAAPTNPNPNANRSKQMTKLVPRSTCLPNSQQDIKNSHNGGCLYVIAHTSPVTERSVLAFI
jgi:hypothetical protein